jgi:hypothetical protein
MGGLLIEADAESVNQPPPTEMADELVERVFIVASTCLAILQLSQLRRVSASPCRHHSE